MEKEHTDLETRIVILEQQSIRRDERIKFIETIMFGFIGTIIGTIIVGLITLLFKQI